MYKCSAENKVGKDERLIYFYVTSKYVGLDFTLLLTKKKSTYIGKLLTGEFLKNIWISRFQTLVKYNASSMYLKSIRKYK